MDKNDKSPSSLKSPNETNLEETNTDIITENIENENNDEKKESLKDICKKLSSRFMFGDIYLFLDLDIGKYVIINYNSTDKFDNMSQYDKQSLMPLLKSMINTRIQNKEVDFFPLNKENMATLTGSVQGVKKSFNRSSPEFFTDTDYLPALNLFKRTPLQEYKPSNIMSYKELESILKSKYKRLYILLKNNIGSDKNIQWFLNWIALEINCPEIIKTTFIIIGEQGSGKSILIEEIFKENIYHFSNVSILDNKTIKDNFNDIYNYKSFIIMNEVSTMDLKENNQIAQDLKRLITDGSYINRGMFKSGVEKAKTFNIGFTTNKNQPVQIESGDRRFTVFGRGKKLLEMKEVKDLNKELGEDFDGFIDNVKIEIKDFLYLIKGLDYDKKVSIDPLMTELKKKIISTTNTKEDLMKSYLNSHNWEGMEALLKGFDFGFNPDTNDEEIFMIKFKKMFDIGIFTNDILSTLYYAIFEIEVNDYNRSEQSKKAGAFWGKILHKPTKAQIKINGNNINIKVMNDDDIESKKIKLKELFSNLKNNIPIAYETINATGEIVAEIDEDEEIPF